jgi:hypothetical protein
MNPGITFHAPENAKECEGMNPHTPYGLPNLQRVIAGAKIRWIEKFLISLESSCNENV